MRLRRLLWLPRIDDSSFKLVYFVAAFRQIEYLDSTLLEKHDSFAAYRSGCFQIDEYMGWRCGELIPGHGQLYGHLQTSAVRAVEGECAIMGFNYFFHHGQSESGSIGLSGKERL